MPGRSGRAGMAGRGAAIGRRRDPSGRVSLRVLVETLGAAGRAEVEVAPVPRPARGRAGLLDGHPANRIAAMAEVCPDVDGRCAGSGQAPEGAARRSAGSRPRADGGSKRICEAGPEAERIAV